MTFFERVTSLREEKGVTQIQMAADLGLNKNTFGKWKQGAIPLRSTQQLLAQYFGVSVEYLLGKTDERKERPTTETGDEPSQEFKSLYCQLSPEQREIVLAAMREFAKEK